MQSEGAILVMVLTVKHTVEKASGLWCYRRYWPVDVRPHFPKTRFIRALGHRDAKGFMSRYELCGDEFAQEVAPVRRKVAGEFDTLLKLLLVYLCASASPKRTTRAGHVGFGGIFCTFTGATPSANSYNRQKMVR